MPETTVSVRVVRVGGLHCPERVYWLTDDLALSEWSGGRWVLRHFLGSCVGQTVPMLPHQLRQLAALCHAVLAGDCPEGVLHDWLDDYVESLLPQEAPHA